MSQVRAYPVNRELVKGWHRFDPDLWVKSEPRPGPYKPFKSWNLDESWRLRPVPTLQISRDVNPYSLKLSLQIVHNSRDICDITDPVVLGFINQRSYASQAFKSLIVDRQVPYSDFVEAVAVEVYANRRSEEGSAAWRRMSEWAIRHESIIQWSAARR